MHRTNSLVQICAAQSRRKQSQLISNTSDRLGLTPPPRSADNGVHIMTSNPAGVYSYAPDHRTYTHLDLSDLHFYHGAKKESQFWSVYPLSGDRKTSFLAVCGHSTLSLQDALKNSYIRINLNFRLFFPSFHTCTVHDTISDACKQYVQSLSVTVSVIQFPFALLSYRSKTIPLKATTTLCESVANSANMLCTQSVRLPTELCPKAQ